MQSLPPYQVRESARAKQVRLKISPQDGLVITVPQGFNQAQLASILYQRHGWIEKHLNRIQAHTALDFPPTQLELHAVGESWKLLYQPSHAKDNRLLSENRHDYCLYLNSDNSDHQLIKSTLQHWLITQGYLHFAPELENLSRNTGLGYRKLQVRQQKTRWGSCSARLTISLNCKLLFLPQSLARYVILHELAHTRHLNHSAKFYDLLRQLEPNYQALDKALDTIGRTQVPSWL